MNRTQILSLVLGVLMVCRLCWLEMTVRKNHELLEHMNTLVAAQAAVIEIDVKIINMLLKTGESPEPKI